MQEEIVGRLQSVFSSPFQKAILAFFLAIFAPVWPALVGLFVLIGIDLICGVTLAVKNSNFSSVRLRQGTTKFIFYPIAIMAVRLGEQQIYYATGKEISYIASFLILYFGLTEMISVLETLSKLGVSVPSPVLMFFKKQIDLNKLPGK